MLHAFVAGRLGGPSVRSRTAHGTEKMGPSEPGQDSPTHGGLSGVRLGEDSATEKSTPPVEVSSSGSAPVAGLSGWLVFLVWERVETQRERPGDSSMSEHPEAELMAQSVSRSGGIHQSLVERLRRPRRPEGPSVVEDKGDCSGFRVGGLRSAVFRLKEV